MKPTLADSQYGKPSAWYPLSRHTKGANPGAVVGRQLLSPAPYVIKGIPSSCSVYISETKEFWSSLQGMMRMRERDILCLDITADELVLSARVVVRHGGCFWLLHRGQHPGWGGGTVLGANALPSCTPREFPLLPAHLQPALSPDVTAQSHQILFCCSAIKEVHWCQWKIV